MNIKEKHLFIRVEKELIDRLKEAKEIMKAKNCNRVVNDILRRELDALLGNTVKQEAN